MGYHDKYLELRESLWSEFELLVQKGATFPELVEVIYPRGVNPIGLSVNTDGASWFYAKILEKNTQYKLHNGVDMNVGTNKVVFVDAEDKRHEIEPDDLDLYWLSKLLDSANKT